MSDSQQNRVEPPNTAFQASFSTGEVAPAFYYRSDQAKWRGAVAQMRNFYLQVQGNVARRPGTEFIGIVKFPNAFTRLIPFQFDSDQQYIVEAGALYFRFIFQGAYLYLADGVTPYEVVTPYAEGDLATLRTVQSADVLTIVHPSYQPMQLERFAVLNWTLTAFGVGSKLAAPTGLAVTAHNGAWGSTTLPATLIFGYAITACSDVTLDEGPQCTSVADSNYDLGYYTQYGVYNQIAWNAVAGADFYKVYRSYQGVWAFVASVAALTFNDTGFEPDTALTPPIGTNPFTGGNWPSCVAYYQERLFFGGSNADTQTIWASQSGNYTNFDVSNPVLSDDAITFTLAARQINQIRHMLPLTDLLIFTSGGGWRLSGANGAVTPSNFDVAPQTFTGVSNAVDPIPVGNYILFVEAKGSSVREIVYNLYVNSYVSEDRTVLAQHLLLGHQIVSWAYAESPAKCVWMVREDGVLLSLTYLKEQDLYAWALHETQGSFISVAIISEINSFGVTEDVPYFVVQRTIGGVLSSRVVRMHSHLLGPGGDDPTQAWYVDDGLQYSGAPVSSVGGLSHLEGATVAILADGQPLLGLVTGGVLALPGPASLITVGLSYASTLQTLPLDLPQQSMFGNRRRISKVRMAVQNTAQMQMTVLPTDVPLAFVGLAADDPLDVSDTTVTSTTVVSGIQEIVPIEGWDRYGQVTLSTSGPLPAFISSLAVQFEVGI